MASNTIDDLADRSAQIQLETGMEAVRPLLKRAGDSAASVDLACTSGNSPPKERLNNKSLSNVGEPSLVCTRCNKAKPIEYFHRNPSKKNGRETSCKECVGLSKAMSYQKRKKKKAGAKARREKTRVLLMECAELTEVTTTSETERIRELLNDVIEAIICKRNNP